MALSDPQTVTIGSAQTLPRVLTDVSAATYQSADGIFAMKVSHQVTRTRKRSLVEVSRKKIAADPLITTLNNELSAVMRIVIDRPLVGFTEAELIELNTGMAAWLSASTNTILKKVLALES